MTHRDPYKIFKSAVDRLIDDLGGIAECSRASKIGTDRLTRYSSLSPQNAGTHINIAALHDLEMLAVRRGGEPIVLRAQADLLGFDVVPRRDAAKPADYGEHATDITRAACAMIVQLQEARTDGSIDESDLATLVDLAAAIQKELAEFRADAARDLNVTPLRASA